jgi:hypothetical protein
LGEPRQFQLSLGLTHGGNFCDLRIDFENLINEMNINAQFSVDNISNSLSKLKKRFGYYYKKIKPIMFFTIGLENIVQNELDRILSDNK